MDLLNPLVIILIVPQLFDIDLIVDLELNPL